MMSPSSPRHRDRAERVISGRGMEATRSRNEGHMAPFSLMDWAALRPWSRVSRSAHSASASSGAEDGDTAAFAAMSNWPWELDGALAERLLETGGHIAIYGHFIPAGTRLLTPELAGTGDL